MNFDRLKVVLRYSGRYILSHHQLGWYINCVSMECLTVNNSCLMHHVIVEGFLCDVYKPYTTFSYGTADLCCEPLNKIAITRYLAISTGALGHWGTGAPGFMEIIMYTVATHLIWASPNLVLVQHRICFCTENGMQQSYWVCRFCYSKIILVECRESWGASEQPCIKYYNFKITKPCLCDREPHRKIQSMFKLDNEKVVRVFLQSEYFKHPTS